MPCIEVLGFVDKRMLENEGAPMFLSSLNRDFQVKLLGVGTGFGLINWCWWA